MLEGGRGCGFGAGQCQGHRLPLGGTLPGRCAGAPGAVTPHRWAWVGTRCSAASLRASARKVPPGQARPKNNQSGLFFSTFRSIFKWKHFKGLCFSFFFFFFKLQTINYELKRKSQPSFPPLKFGGSKHEAAQCRNKTVHPVLSETKAVVGFVLFCLFVCFLELSVP